MVSKTSQNYINHIALVLDMSGSMSSRAQDLVKVVDAQVQHLALKSLEMDQETRLTVYTFDYSSNINCVFYDKDVLRMPSIKDHYRPDGLTALRDATGKALEDLAKTPELYGDHSFLALVFTDGGENDSARWTADALTRKINNLPENWSVGVLVANENDKRAAKRYGFPEDNIAVWSTQGEAGGMVEVGDTIRQATDTYMTNRASGIRGSKSLFSMTSDVVNADSIKAAGLKPLVKGTYRMVVVPPAMNDYQIRDFITGCGLPFQVYQNFYQLMKPEKIQGDKVLAIVHKKTREVFMGEAVRKMVGLPNYETTVRPETNKEYDIYVQSGSVNRKVKVGQNFLVTGLVNQ